MPEHLDGIAARLAVLQAEGSLRWSALGTGARQCLRSLLDTGVLRLRKAGHGQRLEVIDAESLERFIRHQFPEGLAAPPSTSRADAVRRLRSAKRGGNASRYSGVLVRALSADTLGCAGLDGEAFHQLTAAIGAVALVLGRSPECQCRGTVVTVENEDVFYQAEALVPEANLAIYAAGRMSERLIQWLSRQHHVEQVIHAGDYDPVGICEYLRLKETLGERVRLFIPTGLEELFERHGNSAILTRDGNQRAMAKVRLSADPAAQRVAALIDRYGAGLEQEVLLER